MDSPAQRLAVARVDALPAVRLFLPGPQKRGTGGTLNVIGNRHWDRGHPPNVRITLAPPPCQGSGSGDSSRKLWSGSSRIADSERVPLAWLHPISTASDPIYRKSKAAGCGSSPNSLIPNQRLGGPEPALSLSKALDFETWESASNVEERKMAGKPKKDGRGPLSPTSQNRDVGHPIFVVRYGPPAHSSR